MAKKQDTISIGFEEKIWKAADILRGNLSASQYEGVVLGLIFLKYISDRFEQKFQELQGDEYADPEDKDEYTAENIFFVPAEARWSKISAAAHTPEIGVVIDEALTAIERENESLKGILPKNCSFLYLVDYIVSYSYCKLTIIFSIPNSTCQSSILFLVSIYILHSSS